MHADSRTYSCIKRLKDRGFSPGGILDLGAYQGEWATAARQLFPDAYILLLEAMAEKGPDLGLVCRLIGNASYLISVVGADDADAVDFFVANGGNAHGLVQTGSSKFREATSVPIEPRRLRQRRVDSLLGSDPQRFSLAKLDMQGGELDALRGFGHRLEDVEVILAEAAVLPYNTGGPRITDLIAEAARMGFVLSDIGDEYRHFLDDQLFQVDIVLTRETSSLRRRPPYF